MKTIILDAGHGPETPGKRTPDGSLREFQFNRAVAELVSGYLEKEGFMILVSHHSARDVPLHERTNYANKQKADAFISIHANAYGSSWNDANGIETYIYPRASKSAGVLANLVQQSLVQACKRKNRGVKTANFAVLRDTVMPAILIECGFMTNREEAALLRSSAYQKQCARAIAFGVVCWAYKG